MAIDNPYQPPGESSLSDREIARAVRAGLRMVRRGATRGKIVRDLLESKFDEQSAELIADRAIKAHAFENRMAGAVLVAGGLLLSALSWFLLPSVRLSIALTVLGMFQMGVG
ncbi:MAG: hypothetical protein MI861_02570, partial [Pirellulales bacterium]|nr:hypothetical protein [Pirellulales bacterium]